MSHAQLKIEVLLSHVVVFCQALLHRERESAPAVGGDDTPKPVVPAAVPASNPAPSSQFRGSGGLLGERPPESMAPSSSRPPLLDK